MSWLLAWLAVHGEALADQGPLLPELPPPLDPVQGHPGDRPVAVIGQAWIVIGVPRRV